MTFRIRDETNSWNLLLINNVQQGTTLYRYMETIKYGVSKTFERQANTIFLNTSSSNRLPGSESYDFVLGGCPLSTKVNLVFRNIIFGNKIKNILGNLDNSLIYHYAWEGVMPLQMNGLEIVTIHDSPTSPGEKKFYGLDNNKINKYDKIKRMVYDKNIWKRLPMLIANTQHVANGLKDAGFESKIKVVWQPIKPDFYAIQDKLKCRKLLNLPIEKKLILSISTNDPRKNLLAVKTLSQELPENIKIVRVGPPVPNCINLGSLSTHELNILYNAVDLLLFPSFEEGFGYPIIEATGTETPIASSDIPTSRELLGDAALYFDPSSAFDIKSTVLTMIDNNSIIESLKKKQASRRALFDMNTYFLNLIGIYDELINNPY